LPLARTLPRTQAPAFRARLRRRLPARSRDARRGCGVTDQWGAKAMPPLWQYFSRLPRHTSPFRPPKGTDPRTLRLFPCKRPFLGVVRRGHHRHLGPPGKPTPWWWAKAMPPLWQYFALLARKSSRTSRLERDIWALISRGNRTHARDPSGERLGLSVELRLGLSLSFWSPLAWRR
jgi:hypothetical protein